MSTASSVQSAVSPVSMVVATALARIPPQGCGSDKEDLGHVLSREGDKAYCVCLSPVVLKKGVVHHVYVPDAIGESFTDEMARVAAEDDR